MNSRFLTATTASFAILAAGTAHAGARASEEKLMDACIQKFIAENLSDYGGKITVQKLASGHQPLTLSSHHKEITVSAYHRTSGEHLGAVTCKVKADGTVAVAAPSEAAAAKLVKLTKSPVVAASN